MRTLPVRRSGSGCRYPTAVELFMMWWNKRHTTESSEFRPRRARGWMSRFPGLSFPPRGVVLLLLLFSWVSPPPAFAFGMRRPRAESHETILFRGRAAMEDGLYDVAERHFTRAMELASDEESVVQSTAWLARALIARRRPQAAAEAIRERFGAVTDDEGVGLLLYWLARAHYEAGDYEECGAVLEERIGMRPDADPGPDVLRLLGRTRFRQGRLDEALAAFRRFDALYADTADRPENLLDWAEALARADRIPAAMERYTHILESGESSPESWEARIRLAELQIRREDWAGVSEVTAPLIADEAADSNRRAYAWLLRARAARAAGDSDAARRAAAEAEQAGDAEGARKARWLMLQLDIDAGQLDDAWQRVLARIGERPDDAETGGILLRLGDAFRRAGRPADGAEVFQRHVEMYGESAEGAAALLGRAWCLWDQGVYGDAARIFQRFADSVPPSQEAERAEALFKVGDALFAAGRMAEAHDAYLSFGEAFPESAHVGAAFLQAATALEETGAYDEAALLYERIQEEVTDPDIAAVASLRRARLDERRRQWQQAIAAYTRSMERFPDHAVYAKALLSRGLVYYQWGAFREALADFSLLADSTAPAAIKEQGFFMRGWSLYLLGQEEEALAVCRAFVEQFPKSTFAPEVLFWLGEHAFNHGQWAEAEQIFLKLETDFSAHALAGSALYWAGRSAAEGREFVRAIEHYGRLVRAYAESAMLPEARFAQGDALSELGRFDDAILAYREVVRQYPDSYLAVRAAGRVGDCHFTLAADEPGRYEHALRSYQEVLDTAEAPMDLRLQAEYKIGRCLEQLNRVNEAFERYMNVVYGHLEARRDGQMGSTVWFARAGFTAGAIQERQGRWREAIAVYRRVAEAGGTTAEEAQERILRIRRENWRLY